MAYRRKQGGAIPPALDVDELRSPATGGGGGEEPPSLAAQAIRASSAHRDSSLSSAYGESAIASAKRESGQHRPPPSPRDAAAYEYTSMKSLNEPESGFWGGLARKAKSLLDDENAIQQVESHGENPPQMGEALKGARLHQSYRGPEGFRKSGTPSPRRSSDAIASSLNYIGGTIKNALEEGLTIVENRTSDIIQETRKLHIRKKGTGLSAQNQGVDRLAQHGLPQIQTDIETQLKASRDVANAMSAKAKLLLRELKTVKSDLAFAKERCGQLEEENKVLRESYAKGSDPEDDDLIRLQLETLLAEKGRLAHENSVYARENRFLREIVEYHQLTMQDVVYVDEGIEEVSEVSPIHIPSFSFSSHSALPSPVLSTPRNSLNPATTQLPSPTASPLVVPEACPVVPTPPIRSPSGAFTGAALSNTRGILPPASAGKGSEQH